MRAEIENLLGKATNEREVRGVLETACAAHGAVVRAGVMYSGHDKPSRQITGVVEMEDRVAGVIAQNLGVANLGTRLVVFKYPAPEGFEVREP